MKISHKPFGKQKARRGLGQKSIDQFKSAKEYTKEIKELETRRWNYYNDLVKEIQLNQLEFQRNIAIPINNKTINHTTYDEKSDTYKTSKKKYDEKRIHIIKSYNELVKPIDKKLHELRIEIMNKHPKSYTKIDERL